MTLHSHFKLFQSISQNNRLNKIAWSLFLFLFTSIILIIYQTYPISLSSGVSSIMQIPLLFWILSTIALIVWIKLFLYQKDPKLMLLGVVSYYFILFCSNLMFVSPYEQTDRISSYISILDNNAYIGQSQIEIDSYFQWPIFFFLTKIFLLVGDFTLNQVLQIGFYSINLILPIILLFMYNSRNEESDKNYILPVIIYILLSYSFIVNQYAPQALALLLLFLTYAIYYQVSNPRCEKKTVKLGVLFFSFTILVFTHPFMFIFFLAPLAIDYIYRTYYHKKEISSLNGRTILLFTTIYFAGLLYRYVSIQNQFVTLYKLLGTNQGESWNLILSIFNAGSPIIVTPSYYPTLELRYFFLSNSLKLILLVIIIIAGFLMIKYPPTRKFVSSLDISIIITSITLYAVGLFSIFLGQRGIQVAISSVVQPYKTNLNHYKKLLKFILIILLVITPVILVTTSITNIARSGEAFIEDREMNAAGHFLDGNIPTDSNVILAESMYPINEPRDGFNEFSNLKEINDNQNFYAMDYILVTPKFVLQARYFGYNYMITSNDFNCIYSNGVTELRCLN